MAERRVVKGVTAPGPLILQRPGVLGRKQKEPPACDGGMPASEGVPREVTKGTHTPRPAETPIGRHPTTRQASKEPLNAASEDHRPDPRTRPRESKADLGGVPLTELAARIRRVNELGGVSIESGRWLLVVGERRLPRREHADVYLFLGNSDDPKAFVSLCKKVHVTGSRLVVMLVPRSIPLSLEHVQLLRRWDISVVTLKTRQSRRRWKLPWDQILNQRVTEPTSSTTSAYCREITQEGTRPLKKPDYDKLVKRRSEYDMFVDGFTREASCRKGKAKPRSEKLGPKEQSILFDVIEAGKPIRPYATKTGRSCPSWETALRLFQRARRKVDVSLEHRKFRAFRVHTSASEQKLRTVEFAPPYDLRYCFIIPA